MSDTKVEDVIEFAKRQVQQQSESGNLKDALKTLLFLLTLDPTNDAVRERAAQLLISFKESKYRADARELLEDGLLNFGISPTSFKDLIGLYLTHGPIERARQVLDHMGPRAKQFYSDQEYAELSATIDAVAETTPAKGATGIRRTRYPSEKDFVGPLDSLFENHIATSPQIEHFSFAKTDKVFTMGSCFAGRVSRAMSAQGISSFTLTLAETVNTTYANREFLSFLLGLSDARSEYWTEELRERGQNKESISAHLRNASLVIYTLGVAPAFFNTETGAFTPHSVNAFKTRSFTRDNAYRMTSVEENLENLKAIFALLLKINPNIKLVLSVSPVPLSATFERDSAVISDCVSKSVLRVVAEEFCKLEPRVIYWPSFEMVKWVSPHRENFFGTDDGEPGHIADEVVTKIVDVFLKKCLHQ